MPPPALLFLLLPTSLRNFPTQRRKKKKSERAISRARPSMRNQLPVVQNQLLPLQNPLCKPLSTRNNPRRSQLLFIRPHDPVVLQNNVR
jgi:hypothetical protein